jgi:uncharacterized protein (DUF1330 family)
MLGSTSEAHMPAYWVARSRINDPVEYKKYTDRVPAIIAKFGGKVLARGGRFQIMEGPDKFQRFVVIEFPTFEQGVACFTSPEYNEAAAFRRSGAGEVETIMVDGGEGVVLKGLPGSLDQTPPVTKKSAPRRFDIESYARERRVKPQFSVAAQKSRYARYSKRKSPKAFIMYLEAHQDLLRKIQRGGQTASASTKE